MNAGDEVPMAVDFAGRQFDDQTRAWVKPSQRLEHDPLLFLMDAERGDNLIILVAYLLFRAYDVPDKVSERVEPKAAGAMAAEVAV